MSLVRAAAVDSARGSQKIWAGTAAGAQPARG
jgi:hypothetical protein